MTDIELFFKCPTTAIDRLPKAEEVAEVKTKNTRMRMLKAFAKNKMRKGYKLRRQLISQIATEGK